MQGKSSWPGQCRRFPSPCSPLQESIRDHGYAIWRVQRVGIGFTGMGYKTDKYRIVFFGKIDEVRNLAEKEQSDDSLSATDAVDRFIF